MDKKTGIRVGASGYRVVAAVFATVTVLSGCGGGGGGGGGSSSDGNTGVRGVIDIAAGTRVDGDYASLWRANDRQWPAGSRGPVALPVPSITGGYLSADGGTHLSGADYPADADDRYSVSLVAGDRYYLHCFPSDDSAPESLQVSLYLDSSPVPGVSNGDACGAGGRVPAGGAGEIRISADGGGPFRYVLTLAPQGALGVHSIAWPEPPLRLDEAIVTGNPSVNRLSGSGLSASSAMTVVRPLGPDTWVVRRNAGPRAFSLSDQVDRRADTIEWIRDLRETFGVNAEPDYLFRLASPTPHTNPDYNDADKRWNLDQIKLDLAWGLDNRQGQGVGVAVLDTGLFSRNPQSYGAWHGDLAANVVAAGGTLDFVSGDYDVDNAPGPDGNPATPLTPANPRQTSFHGTHVAGIIAAVDNNLGTVGIASKASIVPYRVLGVDPLDGEDGTGAVSDLIAAINAAANRSDVDVINLSLGGLPQVDALQAATDRAYDAGKLVVAAGGNSGDASAVYPAANRRVVGVGATDRSRSLAGYSNYGRSVDLLAPGGSLTEGIFNAYGDVSASSSLTDGYALLAGSSMAAPHVTGVYALMKGAEGNLSPDGFRARLIAGLLTDIGDPDAYDDYALYGMGLLDANKAMASLTAGFPTVVSAWPRVVELNATGSPAQVLLEVLTDPASPLMPSVVGVPSVPTAVRLTDNTGAELTAGMAIPSSVRVRVDPNALPANRALSDEIHITYSTEGADRVLRIPVHLQSADDVAARNAGAHYVLLLDANDYNSSRSRQVAASYRDGRYRYSIGNVAPGEYILVAGTDLDNNGYICESGEACAEYPRTGAREVITVRDGQMSTGDLTTSFRRPGIAETGLPRYGFRGYPIPEPSPGSAPDRSLAPE